MEVSEDEVESQQNAAWTIGLLRVRRETLARAPAKRQSGLAALPPGGSSGALIGLVQLLLVGISLSVLRDIATTAWLYHRHGGALLEHKGFSWLIHSHQAIYTAFQN